MVRTIDVEGGLEAQEVTGEADEREEARCGSMKDEGSRPRGVSSKD